MFRSALRSLRVRRAFSSTAQAPDVSWLRSAPSIYCIPVEWGSQDTFQHVNNVVYHRYIENGRLDYLTCLRDALIKLYGPESAEQKHWTRFMSSRAVGPILKSADIKFRFPVTYPDRVFVGTRLRAHSILTDRFTLEHVVVSEKHNRVAAEGSGTIVAFDYVGTRAKTSVPKEIVAAMLELERQHAK